MTEKQQKSKMIKVNDPLTRAAFISAVFWRIERLHSRDQYLC